MGQQRWVAGGDNIMARRGLWEIRLCICPWVPTSVAAPPPLSLLMPSGHSPPLASHCRRRVRARPSRSRCPIRPAPLHSARGTRRSCCSYGWSHTNNNFVFCLEDSLGFGGEPNFAILFEKTLGMGRIVLSAAWVAEGEPGASVGGPGMGIPPPPPALPYTFA